MKTFHTKDAQETQALGAKLARFLEKGTVVALEGPLGSGKTTFVRGIAQSLGAGESVSSPTFALMHEYRTRPKLIHMDWYRLETLSSADEDAMQECFDADAVCLVEWADRDRRILPEDHLRITFEYEGAARRLRCEAAGERSRRILKKL